MRVQHGLMLLVLLLCVGALVLVSALSSQSFETSDARLTVGATIFPVADLVQRVGGDLVAVELILPPGASPHTFELTPSTALALTNASVIFGIGHGLDPWAENATHISRAPFIALDQHVQLDCEATDPTVCDPHYWLDVANAIGMVQQIADTLSESDPAHATSYQQNALQTQEMLVALDQEIRTLTATPQNTNIITFHESFTYFARAYGFTVRGMVEASPGQEPTPQQLAELQEAVGLYNIQTLFTEPQLSARAVQPFVKDLSVAIMQVDPLGGTDARATYPDMMRFNAYTFSQAR